MINSRRKRRRIIRGRSTGNRKARRRFLLFILLFSFFSFLEKKKRRRGGEREKKRDILNHLQNIRNGTGGNRIILAFLSFFLSFFLLTQPQISLPQGRITIFSTPVRLKGQKERLLHSLLRYCYSFFKQRQRSFCCACSVECHPLLWRGRTGIGWKLCQRRSLHTYFRGWNTNTWCGPLFCPKLFMG